MTEINKTIEAKAEVVKRQPSSIAMKPKTITGKPQVGVAKPTIVTDTVAKNPSTVKSMEYYRAKDAKMVTGIFHYLDIPGGTVEFDYLKYKGDQLKTYKFKDGERRTIPLGVAKHINSCGYNEYEPLNQEMIKGATNSEEMRVVRKKPRFRFQNLDFLDLEETAELDSKDKVVLVESY